jgi:hypothetical protein
MEAQPSVASKGMQVWGTGRRQAGTLAVMFAWEDTPFSISAVQHFGLATMASVSVHSREMCLFLILQQGDLLTQVYC